MPQKILEILLNNGCRLAEPGEFTKRAFLNGRIDLLEAEGVMDLINSKTEKEREIAINELNGTTSKMIKDLRHQILEINANIKVNIDYPEYNDIKEITNNEILEQVSSIENKLKRILEESQDGKLIKEGITATIIGKPNVGKSSILNKLLDEEKAIVTDIAGTTRDIVEGSITISGIKINFLDTAGIRETKNIVENIGVKKSLELIDKSDLILYVLNNNEQLTKEDLELLDKIKNKNHIIIINKIDLPKKIDISMMGNENIIYISALNDDGAFLIKEEIKKLFNFEKFNDKDLTYLTNARTISLIKKAINEFSNVKNSLNMQVPIDMVEIDLEQVAETLGCITGENYSEDLINQMFSNFCLGK
jgi:tRNA modification GTPase